MGGGFVEDGVVISYFCEFLGWVFCVCVFFVFGGLLRQHHKKKGEERNLWNLRPKKNGDAFFFDPKRMAESENCGKL